MVVRLTKVLTMSSKVASSVLSSSSDTCTPKGFKTLSARRMESRKQARRIRLRPMPRHCEPIPVPATGVQRRSQRPPLPRTPGPPGAGLTGADEPHRALAHGHLLDLPAAVPPAQHGVAAEGHGAGRGDREVVQHAHESQVLAVLLALLQQGLRGLGGAPAGQQQAGQGGVWGGRRGRAPVGLQDDVHVGAAEAEGVQGHIAPTDRPGLVHHLQPPVLQRRDLGVRVVEVQVGSPDAVLQGQQHLWVGCSLNSLRSQHRGPTSKPRAPATSQKE